MLDGKKVSTIRSRVMRSTLIPKGFVDAKAGKYVRAINGQIHILQFQPNKFGGEYTAHLGFHYQFIPKLDYKDFEKCKLIENMNYIQTGLHGNLNKIRHGKEKWWKYCDDESSQEQNFLELSTNCIQIFEHYGTLWHNPERFLNFLPPELVCLYLQFTKMVDCEDNYSIIVGKYNAISDDLKMFFIRWVDFSTHLVLFLAYVAINCQNFLYARRYIDLGLSIKWDNEPFFEKLQMLKDKFTL